MKSTYESSLPFMATIAALPGDLQQFIYSLDDAAHRKNDPEYARQCKSDRINAGLEQAYRDFHRTLEAHPLRNRTTILTSKLEMAFERGDYYGLNTIPKRNLIKGVVYSHASTTT